MKRRGFTLIELMVVIAIIIILAAIAIPNYLTMTERAKKSRIASDMATLATGLETFKTDWGSYPTTTATAATVAWDEVSSTATDWTATNVYNELGGTDAGTTNKSGNTNALGEQGPQEYLKVGTLKSIVDPFTASTGTHVDGHIYYSSDGTNWILEAYAPTTVGTTKYLYMCRSDSSSTIITYTAEPATYALVQS